MILPAHETPSDIEEYAAMLGAWHAASGKSLQEQLFTFPVGIAPVLKEIYTLSFLLEKHTGILYETSSFCEKAIVLEWDAVVGNGVIEFMHESSRRQQKFTYTDVKGLEDYLEAGRTVNVYFHFNNGSLKLDGVYI